MTSPAKKEEGFDVPRLKVNDKNDGSASLPSSDKSYSPNTSPGHGRKFLGLKKMIPWKKRSKDLLDVDDPEEVKDDSSYYQAKKKKDTVDSRSRKPELRKQRSRSVDHILTDPTFTANFEVSPQTGYRTSHGENESRHRSPTRSSITDEDSGEFESPDENMDTVDGVENTERVDEQRQRLTKKIEKTKDRMIKLQRSMDANLEEYLESVKGSPDPELSKKAFEKKNLKSNANIVQLQKKLDKYQKALKDFDTRERVGSHTAKGMLRGVRTSVKEISGGVRDGVKAGFSGAVSKFFSSNENITDSNPLSSKSDSESHDIHAEEVEQNGGYEIRKTRTPSPKQYVVEEDTFSLTSANQTSVSASSPKFNEVNADPYEAKLNELLETQVSIRKDVDKALSHIDAIATSLQEERYKTQRLQCQFDELRIHWNDFSELHQNEIMGLRQEMERADERIETVDYRVVERVAEIDETCDTFDARISKIENLHHQQGLTVDDYLQQNTLAKELLTKFLSGLLAILTLIFSVFTYAVHAIAPLTRTRARLISTSILVAFLAFWWHKPDHHLIVIFERYVVERLHEIINFLTKKHIRRKEETEVILNPRANVSS